MRHPIGRLCNFFFNDTATTEIYTLSLHDALPIFRQAGRGRIYTFHMTRFAPVLLAVSRSEEHTSELQSLTNLVCRLLLVKKQAYVCTPVPNRSPMPASLLRKSRQGC